MIFGMGPKKDWLFLLSEFVRGGTGGEVVGWDRCRARAKARGKERQAQINRITLMSMVRSDCFPSLECSCGFAVKNKSYLGLCKV